MPALPPASGLVPSAQEARRLIGWVLLDDEAATLVPVPWRDPLACLGLQGGVPQLSAMSMRLAERLGGPLTFEKLRSLVDEPDFDDVPGTYPLVLLNVGGPAAVPVLLSVDYTRQDLEQRYMFADEVKAVPGRWGISREVWNLLWEKSARKAFTGFQRRGLALTLADVRALAGHPGHGELLRGLVLAVGHRPFVLPEKPAPGEAIVIARASMLSAAERTEWTKRLTAAAPFDQWAFEEKALDVSRCAADPLTLFTHLEARGWQRGPAIDGLIRTHTKAFSDLAVQAVVEYPGVPVKFGAAWTRQRITRCRFEPHESAIAMTAVAEDLEALAS